MKKQWFVPIVCCLLCLSCHEQTLICLSSSPDVAFLAEWFNVSQSQYRVIFNFASDSRETLNQRLFPDLIIDTNLQDTLLSVDYHTLPSSLANPKTVYPDLLQPGKTGNRQKLLPLAFNLPLIAYAHTPGKDEFPLFQSFNELADNAAAYNRRNQWEYTRMGFSPLWDADCLFLAYRQFGLQFIPMSKGFYADGASLQKAQQRLDAWIQTTVGNLPLEKIYRDKYHRYPGYLLLEHNQALFYYYDTKTFFQIPPEHRAKLAFSWIGTDNRVPALEEVLFAGIPQHGNAKKGALAFLQWIQSPENQRRFIRKKNELGIDGFGLLGGFSSLIEVTEDFFPLVYPILDSKLPAADQIAFSVDLPLQLIEAKNEIIKNWMMKKAQGINEWDLNMEIDRWLHFQPISR